MSLCQVNFFVLDSKQATQPIVESSTNPVFLIQNIRIRDFQFAYGRVLISSKLMSWKLRKLEEQITCSVCLGFYTDPKTLPCLHCFCLSCLEGVSSTSLEGQVITCPQCRSHSRVPLVGGIESFSDAYHISNLKKIHSLLSLKSETGGSIRCSECSKAVKESKDSRHCSHCCSFLCEVCAIEHENIPSYSHHELTPCNDIESFEHQLFPLSHSEDEPEGEGDTMCSTHNKPLSLYCNDCSVYVCEDCTGMEGGTHKSHRCESILDSYSSTCQQLAASFNPLKSSLAKTRRLVSGDEEKEIREQAENTTEEIHSMVEGLISLLRQSEEMMKKRVEGIIENKLKVISEQKKVAQENLTQLEECQEYVETAIAANSPDKVLVTNKPMRNRIDEVRQEVTSKNLCHCLEATDIQFFPRADALRESVSHLGDIVFSSHRMLSDCRVQIKTDQLERNESQFMFTFSFEYQDLGHISVPVPAIDCTVTELVNNEEIGAVISTIVTPGLYRVLTSSARGQLRVNIEVCGIEFEEVTVVVPFNPLYDSQAPVEVINDLIEPNGITFTTDGHIVISENSGYCLKVFNSKREFIKSIGNNEEDVETFLHPRGLFSLPDNSFLVLDDHKIRKMTLEGECLARVGREGQDPLEFSYPGGVAVSPNTGKIWITDYLNDRVQILNPDFTLAFIIGGTHGSGNGEFKGPTCVAIDSYGTAYIVDANNDRVQLFKEDDGSYVSQFGSTGFRQGLLRKPVRLILVDNKFLYITEAGSGRVSVFNTQGEFIHYFKYGGENSLMHRPYGLEIDRDGFLYVCDSGNGRVLVY